MLHSKSKLYFQGTEMTATNDRENIKHVPLLSQSLCCYCYNLLCLAMVPTSTDVHPKSLKWTHKKLRDEQPVEPGSKKKKKYIARNESATDVYQLGYEVFLTEQDSTCSTHYSYAKNLWAFWPASYQQWRRLHLNLCDGRFQMGNLCAVWIFISLTTKWLLSFG